MICPFNHYTIHWCNRHIFESSTRPGRRPIAKRRHGCWTRGKKWIFFGVNMADQPYLWIGLREKLQETMAFTIKYKVFL